MAEPASTLAAGSVGTVETQYLDLPGPVRLDCGRELHPVRVAYETYGTLSPRRDNVILVCHALSGDAHAAGIAKTPPAESTRDGFGATDRDGTAGKGLGWWDGMIGPGKAFDTDRFFVVSTNLLGGCRGTTGPSSADPATGGPYGPDFPVITVADMVRTERAFLDVLGIERLPAGGGGALSGGGGWAGGCRRSSGRSCFPIRSTPWSRSPARTPCTRRAWPGTRSRATRSCAIRPGRAVATTAPARRPTAAWGWRGWSATSPTCPRWRCTTSSAGGCSSPTTSATRSPSRSSRSRATC